jgi:hypothetical protein
MVTGLEVTNLVNIKDRVNEKNLCSFDTELHREWDAYLEDGATSSSKYMSSIQIGFKFTRIYQYYYDAH